MLLRFTAMLRWTLVAIFAWACACTTILDFDGYQYVESSTGSGASASASTTASGTAGGGGTAGSGGATGSSGATGSGGAPPCSPNCLNGEGCENNSDCLSFFCNNKVCAPNKALGDSCVNDEECLSDKCQDGFCCDGECRGMCVACANAWTNQANGTCAFVLANTDPKNDCPGTCDGNGMCQ